MAVIEGGTTASLAEVDTTFLAMRVEPGSGEIGRVGMDAAKRNHQALQLRHCLKKGA